jgi:coenzyme F420-reducing hydrogenase beta subunit
LPGGDERIVLSGGSEGTEDEESERERGRTRARKGECEGRLGEHSERQVTFVDEKMAVGCSVCNLIAAVVVDIVCGRTEKGAEKKHGFDEQRDLR